MPLRDGIILIDKNPGFTSSDTVRMAARRLKSGKAGHTGTLDRFASGLLVCVTGSFTRLANYLTDQDKEYEAVIEFGKETSTLDPEGDIIAEGAVPDLSVIESVLPSFRGTVLQRPPAYSAVHIDGKRAYKRAKAGEELVMPERSISIDLFDILEWNPPFLTARIACSKGTYIRSLARDLAIAAGSRASLSALRRTRVGSSLVENAVNAKELNSETPLETSRESMEMILGLTGATIIQDYAGDFLNGKTIKNSMFSDIPDLDDLICFDEDGRFLGVLVRQQQGYRYGMVNGGLRD